MRQSEDLQTDTHLSKDFNRVLWVRMEQCNATCHQAQTARHIECLNEYVSAVHIFFMNTFAIIADVKYEDKKLGRDIMFTLRETQELVRTMIYDTSKWRAGNFYTALDNACTIYMKIIFGLQARNMLVRMSEKEPRGAEVIKYFDTKAGFKKGGVDIQAHKPVLQKPNFKSFVGGLKLTGKAS